MAKKKKESRIRFVKDDDKGLFIDPNYGNENIPLENLSVEVDLAVFERNRSFIKIIEEGGEQKRKVVAKSQKKTPPFNKGTQFGDDNYKLTTGYTQVSDNKYDGAETLGITNVDIDFNSSLMPLITMEMVDIKGKMFQMGNKSPYSSFFKFPYPLFELRIKGYFGKPVTYLLHLTNFKARMDSETGNFVINCTFTGYTYAYLSDILLGYLKAIPHTPEGIEFIRNEERSGDDFVTFEEMYQYAGRLNDKISKLRDSDEIKALAKGYNYTSMISAIKGRVRTLLSIVDTKNFNTKSTDNKIALVKPDNTDTIKVLTKGFETLRRDVRTLNDNIDVDEYKLDVNLFNLTKNTNYFINQPISHFIDKDRNSKTKYTGSIQSLKDEKEFKYVASKVKSGGSLINPKNNVTIIYLKQLIDDIDSKLDSLNKELGDKKKSVANLKLDDLTDVKLTSEDGATSNFNFNLFDYTKVLCDHVDVLMNSIEKVAKEAEDDVDRNTALRSNAENLPDIKNPENYDMVYAFPAYQKKTNDGDDGNVFVDAWIGKDHPNIPEAKFVKNLYRGIVESKQLDETYSELLEEPHTQWYSVNPFDIKIHTGGDNPWESVVNGGEKEIIRMMILRAVIFMGISVRNPTDDEITIMAELEAQNLFSLLKNPKVKNALRSIGDELDGGEISDVIQKEVNKNGDIAYENDFNPVNQNRILTNKMITTTGAVSWPFGDEKTTFERYQYIGSHPNKSVNQLVDNEGKLDEGTRFFLPLYFNNNNNNFNGNTLINTKDKTALRNQGDIFFSDYLGPHTKGNDKPDDGATYIEILEVDKFLTKINKPGYGTAIIGNKLKNDKVWTDKDLDTKNVLFNGQHNTLDFSMISYGEGVPESFSTYFYKNKEILTEGISDFKYTLHSTSVTDSQGSIQAEDDATAYSLLSSPFYYKQNDIGRAFLLLNSIPFRATETVFEKDTIRALFENKAANIKVPYVWILWVGALLHRADGEILKYDIDLFPNKGKIFTPPEEFMFKPQNGMRREYAKKYIMDEVLIHLPRSVKNKFINEFKGWVNSSGFQSIKNSLEIFKTSDDGLDVKTDVIPLWFDAHNEDFSKFLNVENYSLIKPAKFSSISLSEEVTESNYEEAWETAGFGFNFILKLNKEKDAHHLITSLLNEERVITNATWRIWANDLSSSEKVPGDSHPITFKEGSLNKYINAFVDKLISLLGQHYQAEERIQDEVFGSGSIDEIYLTIYKNIKSIYDKWISGDSKRRESFKNLIDSFKFIDRGYNDIGKKFKLNPIHIRNLLSSSYNNSFYSHMSRILDNNNFNFMPLPNFVNLTSKKEMTNLFKAYPYASDLSSSKPSFVCVYSGENSNSLEDGSDFNNDGFDVLSPTSTEGIPDDFKSVPGILINYGDANQSIFKGLELDQAEYGETNESLMVTDQIATSYNNINSVGQNIFDIYNNRAYNAGVELMGNAMLQPFMYFQLNNIPMFRGAYLVTKVSHSIKANHMTTKLKGNRVRRTKTPLIDKESIFYSMIGSFNDIASDSASLKTLNRISTSSETNDEHSNLSYDDYELDLDKQLSPNFKLSEFKSAKDEASMPKFVVENLRELCVQLEIIRAKFVEKYPDNKVIMNITSGYRSITYNKGRGEEGSWHTKGFAADMEIYLDEFNSKNEVSSDIVFNTIYDLIEEGKITNGGLGGYNCKSFGTFTHYDIKDTGDRWRCYDDAEWAKKLKGSFKK